MKHCVKRKSNNCIKTYIHIIFHLNVVILIYLRLTLTKDICVLLKKLFKIEQNLDDRILVDVQAIAFCIAYHLYFSI